MEMGRDSSTLLLKSALRRTDRFTFGARQAVELEKQALYFCFPNTSVKAIRSEEQYNQKKPFGVQHRPGR